WANEKLFSKEKLNKNKKNYNRQINDSDDLCGTLDTDLGPHMTKMDLENAIQKGTKKSYLEGFELFSNAI
ncbi:45641_t:CDS:1, partial [Gigaspora margarita]